MTKTCEHCGQPYTRRDPHQSWARFQKSRFCSAECAHVGRRRRTVEPTPHQASVIEDVEWIIHTDSPERIAQRLGYKSPQVLGRLLHKWGRHDLAVVMERVWEMAA